MEEIFYDNPVDLSSISKYIDHPILSSKLIFQNLTFFEEATEVLRTYKTTSLSSQKSSIIIPIGKNSEKIYTEREHALIGISPFNSYFVEERLIKLFDWSLRNFKRISIFLPNQLSIFTLQGLGYTESKAVHKTKRQDSYLKNKVLRALSYLGIESSEVEKLIITMPELLYNPRYQELLQQCIEKFNTDADFRINCFSTTLFLLANNPKANEINNEKLNIAVKYFLYEFPLFVDTPTMLKVPSSVFVYHNVPSYLKILYENDSMISPKQGFLKVEFP